MSGSLTENFKLRSPLSECRKITVPAGTAMGAAITAGTVKQFNGVLAIAVDDVAVDDSNDSLKDSVWVTYAPKVEVTKVTHATDQAWTAGKTLYHNGTAFTVTSTNLARCGYALETVLSTASSGLMCFQGDLIASDIVAGS